MAEQLPFITTVSDPGIHRNIIYICNSLKTKQILENIFLFVINKTHRIRYDLSRLLYYDRICFILARTKNGHFGNFILLPYSNFNRVGEFNGIRLTKTIIIAVTNNYIRAHGDYF